jgi:hypothetical protein
MLLTSPCLSPGRLSRVAEDCVPAAQTVGHVHFHVAGTLSDGGTEWGDVPELSLAETEAIAAQQDERWANDERERAQTRTEYLVTVAILLNDSSGSGRRVSIPALRSRCRTVSASTSNFQPTGAR